MSETAVEKPALFEGATHRRKDTGEPVKATHWKKDGDHPMVERYPIEGRVYKGLLKAGPKVKHSLVFGDWILEDAKGRLWVASNIDAYEAVTE